MKYCLSLLFVCSMLAASAQSDPAAEARNREFPGAAAKLPAYNAIFQLDTNDQNVIHKAIRNINNALGDARLAGKIHVELVTFSSGTEAVLKGSAFENDLRALVAKGVIVAQCANTLRERNIPREQLYDFVALVPSGTGELIIRQAEGWSVVKP